MGEYEHAVIVQEMTPKPMTPTDAMRYLLAEFLVKGVIYWGLNGLGCHCAQIGHISLGRRWNELDQPAFPTAHESSATQGKDPESKIYEVRGTIKEAPMIRHYIEAPIMRRKSKAQCFHDLPLVHF